MCRNGRRVARELANWGRGRSSARGKMRVSCAPQSSAGACEVVKAPLPKRIDWKAGRCSESTRGLCSPAPWQLQRRHARWPQTYFERPRRGPLIISPTSAPAPICQPRGAVRSCVVARHPCARSAFQFSTWKRLRFSHGFIGPFSTWMRPSCVFVRETFYTWKHRFVFHVDFCLSSTRTFAGKVRDIRARAPQTPTSH